MKKKKWPVIAGVVLIAAFVVAMALSSMKSSKYRVEVCVTFNGQTNCRNGASNTMEDAERTAVTAACQDMTSGMTQFMQCQSNGDRKVTWRK